MTNENETVILGPRSASAVDFVLGLFRFLLEGHDAHTTTDDAARVIGRPARDFRDLAAVRAGRA